MQTTHSGFLSIASSDEKDPRTSCPQPINTSQLSDAVPSAIARHESRRILAATRASRLFRSQPIKHKQSFCLSPLPAADTNHTTCLDPSILGSLAAVRSLQTFSVVRTRSGRRLLESHPGLRCVSALHPLLPLVQPDLSPKRTTVFPSPHPSTPQLCPALISCCSCYTIPPTACRLQPTAYSILGPTRRQLQKVAHCSSSARIQRRGASICTTSLLTSAFIFYPP